MPSSSRFFMMFALIYIFSIRAGCHAINWCQKKLFCDKRDIVVARPITRHVSIVTFMELTTMIRRELHIRPWGANIRMAIATVIVFWTAVEVVARNGFITEIWVALVNHILEMTAIFIAFIGFGVYLWNREVKVQDYNSGRSV